MNKTTVLGILLVISAMTSGSAFARENRQLEGYMQTVKNYWPLEFQFQEVQVDVQGPANRPRYVVSEIYSDQNVFPQESSRVLDPEEIPHLFITSQGYCIDRVCVGQEIKSLDGNFYWAKGLSPSGKSILVEKSWGPGLETVDIDTMFYF